MSTGPAEPAVLARKAFAELLGSLLLAATVVGSGANPAITIGRAVSDTFAGIAPGSVGVFVVMQLPGGALAVGAVALLYPDARRVAGLLAAGSDHIDVARAR